MNVEEEQSLRRIHKEEGTHPQYSNRITAILAGASLLTGVILVDARHLDQYFERARFFLESLGIGK